MRPISKKKLARKEERTEAIQIAWQRDQGCIFRRIVYCKGLRLDPDEIIPRSSWTEGIYEPSNIQFLCDTIHDIKHHVEVEAAMIVGLYGKERMLRYDMTVEERIEYMYKFTGKVNIGLAVEFIEKRLRG